MRIALLLAVTAAPALADPPEVVQATATPGASGWTFSVTIRHPDTGWDDYADGWEVLAPDGTRLGYRELLHPHVNEQPFTRSLSGVAVPEDLTQVLIRARDNVGGWAEATYPLDLPKR
jgi:hypothetical protein